MADGNRNGARAKERARKRANAERQAKLREIRDAAGLCRTCGRPATHSERTGKLARQCKKHLKVDNQRKAIILLTWSRRPARAIGVLFGAR
jgi:hypothetical protein